MTTPVIFFDGTDLRRNPKGAGRTTQSLAVRLPQQHHSARYVVAATVEGASLLGRRNLDICTVKPVQGVVWDNFMLPMLARRHRADLIYTQREVVPAFGPPVVAHIHEHPAARWARSTRRDVKERVAALHSATLFERRLRRARIVIASSHATAADLAGLVAPERLRVVPLAVEDRYFDHACACTGDRLRGRRYIFHLGSDDVRDNTPLVVKAYEHLVSITDNAPALVVAGDLGTVEPEVRASAAALARGQVQLRGYVGDDDLVELYAHAAVTVLLAEAEGFGYQPLEALAAGSRVLLSDTPAVREAVGEAAVYVRSKAPDDVASHLAAIIAAEAADDADCRRVIASRYRWSSTVRSIAKVLEEALEFDE